MYPVSLPPQSLKKTQCLDIVARNPKAGQMFADFFYETESHEDFAAEFFAQKQAQLHSKTGCVINDATPAFSCANPGVSYPVCGAKLDGLNIAVVKDYVDSARMIVSKPSNDIQGKLAPVRSSQNWKTLYLPNSGECYDSLLDGGMDSQVYSYDLNQYVRAYDRRFVFSDAYERSCKKQS